MIDQGTVASQQVEAFNQNGSKVLLVCIYDTIVFEITNDLIYSRFHEYGTIVRLLIFEKKEVTKLFIEFETANEAVMAKQNLDGKKLCNNICKMSIYFSTFNNVDLKHQTSEGIQFYNQYDHTYSSPSNAHSNSSNYDKFSYDSCSPEKRDYFEPNPFSHDYRSHFMQRSKTDQKDLDFHVNFMRSQDIWGFPIDISSQIESDIDSILQEDLDENFDKWSTTNPENSMQQLAKTKTTPDTMNVLGFYYKHPVKHSQIYNLFSNFGNISMIMITRKEVRVKFRTAEFAAVAQNYLKSFVMEGNKIQLFSLSSSTCHPQEGEYSQVICYDQSFHRFTVKKSITINAPSRTLHVSGMKKDKCTVEQLKRLFSPYHCPTNVKILKQSTEKNMALVEFNSFQESFKVISDCHNMNVSGRKVQISFTKSQI